MNHGWVVECASQKRVDIAIDAIDEGAPLQLVEAQATVVVAIEVAIVGRQVVFGVGGNGLGHNHKAVAIHHHHDFAEGGEQKLVGIDSLLKFFDIAVGSA